MTDADVELVKEAWPGRWELWRALGSDPIVGLPVCERLLWSVMVASRKGLIVVYASMNGRCLELATGIDIRSTVKDAQSELRRQVGVALDALDGRLGTGAEAEREGATP